MRKTKKIMAALLTAAMVIGSLTGCGGGNSATSTNDKGEIAELINAVQPESGEYDPAGAAAYEYFSVQTNCYEGFVNYDRKARSYLRQQIIGMSMMMRQSILSILETMRSGPMDRMLQVLTSKIR